MRITAPLPILLICALLITIGVDAQEKTPPPGAELAALMKEISQAGTQLKDPYSEAQIILKLAGRDDPAIVSFLCANCLEPARKRSDFIIRLAAAEILSGMKNPDCVKAIAAELGKSQNPVVKRACAESLGRIGNPVAAPALIKELGGKNSDVTAACAAALGMLKVKEAVAPLIEALNPRNREIETYICEALVNTTGADFGRDRKAWEQWWKANKDKIGEPSASAISASADVEYPITMDFHFEGRSNATKKKALLKNFGGNEFTEAIKNNALDWLARHQDDDGRWSAKDFHKHCPTHPGEGDAPIIDPKWATGSNENPWGCSDGDYDIGVTGLALMAFLGDGRTHRHGDSKEVIRKGLDYLMRSQGEDGRFPGGMYHQGIATHALIEAYGLTRDPAIGRVAQKSVNFICWAQQPDAAWRYEPRSPVSDMSVTSWQCMALQSAHRAALVVPAQNLIWAKRWIDFQTAYMKAEDITQYIVKKDDMPAAAAEKRRRREQDVEAKEYGEVYYSDEMENGQRKNPSGTPANTAAAVLVRIFQGATPKDRLILAGSAYVVRPQNLPSFGSPNVYAWLYGSQAMFQVGGAHWALWNEALVRAMADMADVDARKLMPTRTDCERGSIYHPGDGWVKRGGRVMNTALGALCLESYYFYPVIKNE
ncbi:MAG TPA: HEAT repeat domain-containing protein [Candidatus Brocadiia bacterium]|nr:HEAT repeat domain-containing protein [Candidatus Brocadiia bacterium]